MERMVTLEEISDGKLYTASDLVKADCQDCQGCSACCRGMGNSIILDPYDVFRLEQGLGLSFEELLSRCLDLNVAEGLILPNLRMAGPEEKCVFNNAEGRCSIHPLRPGLCRLFPLGRYYENNSFRYYLQTHECKKTNRTKIKIKKWLDTPNLPVYEAFISDWHYFLKGISETLRQSSEEALARSWNLKILQTFYAAPWDLTGDFYEQFYARRRQV